jgi:hypothetical protein
VLLTHAHERLAAIHAWHEQVEKDDVYGTPP